MPRHLAVLDAFSPAQEDVVERVRNRFFVAMCFATAAVMLVGSLFYLVSPEGIEHQVLPVTAAALPFLIAPWLHRRGASRVLLSVGLMAVAQTGLAGSAVLDRGVDDVAMFWIAVSPLLAALAGGVRAAAASAATATVAALVVLGIAETGYVFPEPMAPELSRRFHIGSVAGVAMFVAVLAWLYEGLLLPRVRELARRLGEANADLRRELAARRRAQARAEAASRAKDALLANMSHEFRTPLTAVLGGTEILRADGDGDPLVLDSIDRGARRLLATLDGVLDLAWVESGEFGLDLEPIPVEAAIRGAVLAVRPEAARKGLGLELHLEPAVVAADRAALGRVVQALVHNAVRFTPAGQITVTVRHEEARVVIEVTDTGIGIPSTFLPEAFEPFRQASVGDARAFEGVGLGLTIARRLVEEMGGEIAIESEEGRGTSVRASIPAALGRGLEPRGGTGRSVVRLVEGYAEAA